MVYLERKKIGRYSYWYAIKKGRVDGKLKKVWQLYLGSAERVKEVYERSGEMKKLKSFEYGKTAALFDVNQGLGFVDIVDDHAKLKRRHGLTVGEYMLLLIMGRCDSPLSRNAMGKWFRGSCMSLLWKFRHKLSSQNFLNHMGRLDKVRKDVEADLAKVLIDGGLKPSVLIWDRTNFYTYIEHGQELPRKGHSKHHRNDKNLVDLGLVVSDHNVPFLHTVHEANLHDAKSFPKMLDELVGRLTTLDVNTEDLVLVFDKGNNSEPNIEKVLKEMHVVGSVRHSQAKELMEVPLEKYDLLYTNKKKHKIKGYRSSKMELFGSEFTVLVTHNEATHKRQFATYERNKKRIFEKLGDLKRRLDAPKKKGKKRTMSGIEREVSDIIRKNMRPVIDCRVSRKKRNKKDCCYTITYGIKDNAEKCRLRTLGKNVLFTDLHAWSSKRIAKTYNSKQKVEDDFKWFNDTALISMKPFFSRLDCPVRVHVFLCVMAMLFYRYLFWKLRKKFDLTGQRILEELKGVRLAVVKTDSGGPKLVFEAMTPLQARLFSSLDLGRFIGKCE